MATLGNLFEVIKIKRDMDLIRKILLYVEENYVLGKFSACKISIADYDFYIVKEHCLLLIEAGLLRNLDSKTTEVLTTSDSGILTGNLTNKGYDFLEMIRQDTVWNKTKDAIRTKGLPVIYKTIETISSAIIKSAVEGATKAYLDKYGS